MKKYLLITGISFLVTQQTQAILFTGLDDVSRGQAASRSPTQFTIGRDTFSDKQQMMQWDNLAYPLDTGSDARLDYPASIHEKIDVMQHYRDKRMDAAPAEKKNYQPQVRIPEPTSLGLMLLGAMGIFIIRRKNRG